MSLSRGCIRDTFTSCSSVAWNIAERELQRSGDSDIAYYLASSSDPMICCDNLVNAEAQLVMILAKVQVEASGDGGLGVNRDGTSVELVIASIFLGKHLLM